MRLQMKQLISVLSCAFALFLFNACNDDPVNIPADQAEASAKVRENRAVAAKAPLYWNPYAYFMEDKSRTYLPESVWQENIDWVAEKLLPSGYKMICIDGWGDVICDEYGYRITHTKEWKNDYSYWAKYIKSKGLEFGMYDNPLWVHPDYAKPGVKVKGTNIELSTLINKSENAKYFYWIQVDRPGAEEYVKGCIGHWAEMGVTFLRVDFLSWYETGYDKGSQVGIINRPRAHYETALQWMREACDRYGIFLSLVMPNLTNDGEYEAIYGDMIRINEDLRDGGWYRFSQFDRGKKFSGWSQYHNTMDGFAYFSRISGRNKVILDGDFTRLISYANNEKETVISQHLIAGGPVAVTDRKGKISDSDLEYYKNEEMLALNRDGFVGKPLSSDPQSVNSQIWTGQMSNGDWVVALFNREGSNQYRSIDFATCLGIRGYASVRDLWRHEDKGLMDSYGVWLGANSCVVLRVKAVDNSLPQPWCTKNLGNVKMNGLALYDASVLQFQVKAAGADIEGTSDEGYFVNQQIYGDFDISATVNSLDNINDWSKAGLMIRSSLFPGSQNAMIAVTPSKGIIFQRRMGDSQGTTGTVVSDIKAPLRLKIKRVDNVISAYYAESNSSSWIPVGSPIAFSMPDDVYVGMAVTSHNTDQTANALFRSVIVNRYPSFICPWRKADIGSVGQKGKSDFNTTEQQYVISGSGNDIEGTADQFNFTFKEITSDNFRITAQVVSLDNTNAWAKAGLMIRSSYTQSNASNVMVALTPSYGVIFQRRQVDGWGTSAATYKDAQAAIWLQLQRKGSQFTAYCSKDKVNWEMVGTTQTVNLPDKVYVGMAVTAHDNNKLANACFKNVTIE